MCIRDRICLSIVLAFFTNSAFLFSTTKQLQTIESYYAIQNDPAAKLKYLEGWLPVRKLVHEVNKVNTNETPVAFLTFGAPHAAGLKAEAIHANWYNYKFFSLLDESTTEENNGKHNAMKELMKSYDIEYFIVQDNFQTTADQFSSADYGKPVFGTVKYLKEISQEVVKIREFGLYKIKE